MTLDELVHMAAKIDVGEGRYAQVADGLVVGRSAEPYGFEMLLYEPLACLILQGEKETAVGERSHVVSAGECIVVSHALPVVARVTEASEEAPYLALVAPIDLGLLRSLDHDLADDFEEGPSAASFSVQPADDKALQVFGRYLALADDEADARVLGPAVRRELHYRLLRGSSGAMLRSLLKRGSHANHIAQAIGRLRERFRDRLEMDALAREVGMSPSSFYRHFKEVTSTTPLQYQKNLRLTEAQRLLRAGDHTVATAAFAVGYESPSQFSREFSRAFGSSPRSQIVAARA